MMTSHRIGRLLVLIAAVTLSVWGQTPTPDPELARLQAQNAILAEQVKLAAAQKTLADSAVVPNADLVRLQTQNVILAEQVKVATAQKSLVDAAVPKFTGGVDGSITLAGDTPAEAVQAAYEALSAVSGLMAADIRSCTTTDRVMIFNATELAAFDGLNAFRLQSRLLNDLFIQTLLIDLNAKPSADSKLSSPAALLAGPAIQSFIDLTKLFRVNRETTAKDITPDDKAFLSLLASKLQGRCQVFYPDLVSASPLQQLILPAPPGEDSDDLQTLTTVFVKEPANATLQEWLSRVSFKTAVSRIRVVRRTAEKARIDQDIEKLAPEVKKWQDLVASIDSLKAALADLQTKLAAASPADKPAIQKQVDAKKREVDDAVRAKLDPDQAGKEKTLNDDKLYSAQLGDLLKLLTAAVDAGNAYRADLLKGDGAGITLLSRLTRTARLEDQLLNGCGAGCNSSVLHLSVQKLTASTLKKTNILGTKFFFSGGAIATYLQFQLASGNTPADGSLIKSGTFSSYQGPIKPRKEVEMAPAGAKKL